MKKNRLSQRLTWLVGLIGLLSVFYAGPVQAGDWLYFGFGFDLNMTTLGNNRDYDSFGGGGLFYIGSRVHRSVAIEIKSVLDGQRYQYHFRYNINLNFKLFVPSPRQTEPYFMIGGGYGGDPGPRYPGSGHRRLCRDGA